MKQLFEKKEYPQSKPEKEGEYYDTNKGNIYWDGIMFLSPMESPISLTTIKWFYEPVPEVNGAEEFLKEKGFEFYENDFFNLRDLLTEFAVLQQKDVIKAFEVDFGAHVRARIELVNGLLKCTGAIDGYGYAIPLYKITIEPTKPTTK